MRPGGPPAAGGARGGPAGPRRARGGAAGAGRGAPAGRPAAGARGGRARARSGGRLGAPGREAVDLGSRIVRVDPLQEWLLAPPTGGWDAVCDVRSPSEYTEDHVPGAINYPVLSDSERAFVGTLYKQTSPFAARREGAALVADNLAKILRDPRWAELPADANVLVYCWRGGDRSLSLAHTLSRVGWNIFIVDGGYKGYRKSVRQALQGIPDYHFHMIGGPTGSAKGLFLEALESLGAQVLDLEGAANHKGSVLGESVHAPQPSQKLFETEIARKIKGALPLFSFPEPPNCRNGTP